MNPLTDRQCEPCDILHSYHQPLARPSQATKISKPNRFSYPFRSRPRGIGSPLWLNSPAAKTSSYRDMANFGLGVCPGPRPGPLCMLRMGVRPQCLVILSNTTRAKWAHPLSRLDHAFRAAEASRYLCDVNFGFTTLMSQY